jgi:ABC-type uncharacterized transport system YnjBCD substrate-binding protein
LTKWYVNDIVSINETNFHYMKLNWVLEAPIANILPAWPVGLHGRAVFIARDKDSLSSFA